MVPFLNGNYFGLGPKEVLLLSKINLTLVRVHVRTFGCVDQQSVSCPIIVSHRCVVMLPLLYTDTHSHEDWTDQRILGPRFHGCSYWEWRKSDNHAVVFFLLFWCVLRTIIILIVEQD